jgi:hypothetical protein
MTRLAVRVLLFPTLTLPPLAVAENPPPSDPQGLTLAAQAIAALSGTTPISDVMLSGNVTWTIRAVPQTGTATASAKGTTSRPPRRNQCLDL